MHWGQIKTLFIICFLLLDIYLFYLVMLKQDEADIGVLSKEDVSIEQQLEQNNISIEVELPEAPPDEAFISISQKSLVEEELEQLDQLENQEIEVVDDKLIVSKFDTPIPVPEDMNGEMIHSILQSHVLYPSEYMYDSWNKELNILIFFQIKNDRPVYFNQNGIILVYLNAENEMVAYTQSILGDHITRNEEKPLIDPLMAVTTLYDNNQLMWGETVNGIDMGYHMMLPLDNGVHVLVPTWKVTINEGKNRYVNAVERLVFPVNDEELLMETVQSNLEKIRQIEGNEDFETMMIQLLNSKIQTFKSE